MSRLSRSLAVVPLAAAVSATLLVSPAVADKGGHGKGHRPDTLPLVTGSMPEGISAGPGTTFFAGARRDGAVYVGDARREGVRQLVPGREGEVAVGMLYDERTRVLWVAGGATGDIKAYDARTGELLFQVNTGSDRFLNDVAITRDAVYVTDSTPSEADPTKGDLLVVPLGPGGAVPEQGTGAEVLTLRGDYVQPAGFGLNGIRVLPGGDLITVSGGVLYVVDPSSGVADRVEVSGVGLTGGDGLVLRGRTLYVVRGLNPVDSVVVLRLREQGREARFVREIRDDDFDVPTTAALVAGDLLVVNGQFTSPPEEATEVVRVDRR